MTHTPDWVDAFLAEAKPDAVVNAIGEWKATADSWKATAARAKREGNAYLEGQAKEAYARAHAVLERLKKAVPASSPRRRKAKESTPEQTS